MKYLQLLTVLLAILIFFFVLPACEKKINKNVPSSSPTGYLKTNPSVNQRQIFPVELTFIHTGDFHGDLTPHANTRADNNGLPEGGLARVATIVKKIKASEPSAIHIHTGDTISGSAVATFTRGQALVEVVDKMGIDVFVPGNWEFSFGIYRYLQFFGTEEEIVPYTVEDESKLAVKIPFADQGLIESFGEPFKTERRWGAIISNAYFNGLPLGPGIAQRPAGERLGKPTRTMMVNGIKLGFIGCTTNRGPQIVSSNITSGISFTNCNGEVKFPQNKPIQWPDGDNHNQGEEDPSLVGIPAAEGGDTGYVTISEIKHYINHLRNEELVDLVIVLTEGGIAENIYNAENISGVDIYFSSDMHEETKVPVVVTSPDGRKTIIVEQGEDGAQVGELEIEVHDGRIAEWEWTAHDINTSVPEDPKIADLIEEITEPFYSEDFIPGRVDNPYNLAKLMKPLDEVIGYTDMDIERNRFSFEWNPEGKIMPAVISGTGHALVTDVFRILTNAQVGGIRGFRYSNTIPAGDLIKYDDLYHYFPIGAMIAKANIPTSPASELAQADIANIQDVDGDGRTLRDNKENPRHYLAWPRSLFQEIELSGNSTMNPIIFKWGGGWVFNYSGIHFDFMPTGKNFNKYGAEDNARVFNATFLNGDPVPTQLGDTISLATYYYDADVNRINRNKIVPQNDREAVGDLIQILSKDAEDDLGNYVLVNPSEYHIGMTSVPQKLFPLDVVEAIARYIRDVDIDVFDWDVIAMEKSNLLHTAKGLGGAVVKENFDYPRINLINDNGETENTLVDSRIEFGFPVIEPLRGAEGALINGNIILPDGYIKGVADTPSSEGVFFP